MEMKIVICGNDVEKSDDYHLCGIMAWIVLVKGVYVTSGPGQRLFWASNAISELCITVQANRIDTPPIDADDEDKEDEEGSKWISIVEFVTDRVLLCTNYIQIPYKHTFTQCDCEYNKMCVCVQDLNIYVYIFGDLIFNIWFDVSTHFQFAHTCFSHE